MVRPSPERALSLVVSQSHTGGLNLLAYETDPFVGHRSWGTLRLVDEALDWSSANGQSYRSVAIHGDIGDENIAQLLATIGRPNSLEFVACSAKFICRILEAPGRLIRHLKFSWCSLDEFPSAFEVQSIGLEDCWCPAGVLATVRVVTVRLRLPSDTPWYLDVIPNCRSCFVTASDTAPDNELLRSLSARSLLKLCVFNELSIDRRLLAEILSIPCERLVLHGTLFPWGGKSARFLRANCVIADMSALECRSVRALAACLREQISIRSLELPPVQLDLPLLQALASMPNLSDLGLTTCLCRTLPSGVILPKVKTLRPPDRMSLQQRAWFDMTFPNAESMGEG